jgi:hypothetical protein
MIELSALHGRGMWQAQRQQDERQDQPRGTRP